MTRMTRINTNWARAQFASFVSFGSSAHGPGAEKLVVAHSMNGSHFFLVTPDPHAELRHRALESVLHGRGESNPAIRRAAADGHGVPAELQGLVDKIHRHAYKVTDEDLARLRSRYADDQLFEIVVSAALGASERRLLAGLKALDEA